MASKSYPSKSNGSSLPPELALIAAKIRQHTAAAVLDIGRLLLAAKAKAEHGQWTEFLEHAGLRPRTARASMQIVRAIDSGEISSETLADIGTRAALRRIAKPKTATVAVFKEAGAEAVAWWRAALDAYADDPDERSKILQGFPDGPLSVVAWAKWGDAVMADDPAESWALRPWQSSEIAH